MASSLLLAVVLCLAPALCFADEWVLVFRQTVAGGTFQSNELSANSNDPTADKYAILDQLETFRDVYDNSFTFQMVWPTLCNDYDCPSLNIKDSQTWSQTSNPVTTKGVTGYVPMDISYTGGGWFGLDNSPVTKGAAILDGSVGISSWWYAIGATKFVNGYILGPFGYYVDAVELYVLKKSATTTTVAPSTTASTKRWIKICSQRLSAGFFGPDDWQLNADNETASNFCDFEALEQYRDSTGKFTFRLHWPNLCPNQCINDIDEQIWKQSTNPYTTTTSGVDGYEAVLVTYTDGGWGGLEKSSIEGGFGLVDGSVSSATWWYAVGTSKSFLGKIPGPYMFVDAVDLYVQTDPPTTTTTTTPLITTTTAATTTTTSTTTTTTTTVAAQAVAELTNNLKELFKGSSTGSDSAALRETAAFQILNVASSLSSEDDESINNVAAAMTLVTDGASDSLSFQTRVAVADTASTLLELKRQQQVALANAKASETCGNNVCNPLTESCSSCDADCGSCSVAVSLGAASNLTLQYKLNVSSSGAAVLSFVAVSSSEPFGITAVHDLNLASLSSAVNPLTNKPQGAVFSGVSFLVTPGSASFDADVVIDMAKLKVVSGSNGTYALYFFDSASAAWTDVSTCASTEQIFSAKKLSVSLCASVGGQYAVFSEGFSFDTKFETNLVSAISGLILADSGNSTKNATAEEEAATTEVNGQVLNVLNSVQGSLSKNLEVGTPPAVVSTPSIYIQSQMVTGDTLVGDVATSDGGPSVTLGSLNQQVSMPDQVVIAATAFTAGVNPYSWGANANLIQGPLLDFHLADNSGEEVKVSGLTTPVIIYIPRSSAPLYQQSCRFWNASIPKAGCANPGAPECMGDWSSEGMAVVPEKTTDSMLACSTTHFTSFGAGVDFTIVPPKVSLTNFSFKNSYIIYSIYFTMWSIVIALYLYAYREKRIFDKRQLKDELGLEALQEESNTDEEILEPKTRVNWRHMTRMWGFMWWQRMRHHNEFISPLFPEKSQKAHPKRFMKISALCVMLSFAAGVDAIFVYSNYSSTNDNANSIVIKGVAIPLDGVYGALMGAPVLLIFGLILHEYFHYVDELRKARPEKFRNTAMLEKLAKSSPKWKKAASKAGLLGKMNKLGLLGKGGKNGGESRANLLSVLAAAKNNQGPQTPSLDNQDNVAVTMFLRPSAFPTDLKPMTSIDESGLNVPQPASPTSPVSPFSAGKPKLGLLGALKAAQEAEKQKAESNVIQLPVAGESRTSLLPAVEEPDHAQTIVEMDEFETGFLRNDSDTVPTTAGLLRSSSASSFEFEDPRAPKKEKTYTDEEVEHIQKKMTFYFKVAVTVGILMVIGGMMLSFIFVGSMPPSAQLMFLWEVLTNIIVEGFILTPLIFLAISFREARRRYHQVKAKNNRHVRPTNPYLFTSLEDTN